MSWQGNKAIARHSQQTEHSPAADLEALALLPSRVRCALYEYNTRFSATDTLKVCRARGVEKTLELLRITEHDDIKHFAREYYARYRQNYPFVAAGGTIMRRSIHSKKRAQAYTARQLRRLAKAGQPVVAVMTYDETEQGHI